MPYLELLLTLPSAQQQRAEQVLEDLGALSVTLADAHVDTPDERAIFEPGVGEMPLWDNLRMQALFEVRTDRRGLLAALGELLPELAPEQIELHELPDQDWTRAWMDRYQPMRFGARLWVYPWNIEPDDRDAGDVVLRLDPGLAFGSGTHATTALCLEWLEALDLRGTTVLDYGCGSGILAIAALKLGAGRVLGVDIDPQAVLASRQNAEQNLAAAEFYLPDAAPKIQVDVVVANILANPLKVLAPMLAQAVRPGGQIVLSGVLAPQAEETQAVYRQWFDIAIAGEVEGWVCLAGVKK